LSGAPAQVASAEALPCSRPPEPEAHAIMHEIERGLRSGTQVTHMQISTRYPEHHPLARHFEAHPETKSLWAVFDSDERETRTLYVFSGPGRLAGTTLLLRDRIATLEGDAMWLYLRAFESLSRIESSARRRTVVPGTSLTYEDAKGFIASDKYAFSFWKPWNASESQAQILACPVTPELARDLGYRELRLTVDVEKSLVRAIDYLDLTGKPLKQYRALQVEQRDHRWFPKQVVLEHLPNATLTWIEYETWLPAGGPPETLFEPSVDEEAFRPRILRYLDTIGQGDRIRDELARADAAVQRWEDRWGRRQGIGPEN
jgi:hypothetical protein